MFTDAERRRYGLTDERVALVAYCLQRTSQEMGFPVDLNFIRKATRRAAILEAKAHFTKGLTVLGGDEWTKTDVMRVIGAAHGSSVSGHLQKAYKIWSPRYWRGFQIRARSDFAVRAAA